MSLPLPKKLAEDLSKLNSRYKSDSSAALGGLDADGSRTVGAGSGALRRSMVVDDSMENAMFDSILGGSRPGSSYSRNNNSSFSTANAGSRPSSRSEDRDFHNAVLTRLQKAELEISTMRRDYAKLLATHEKTKAENRELHRQLKALGLGEYDLEALLEENRELSDQVQQMEAFLKDYGLTWVGGESHLRGSRAGEGGKAHGPPSSALTPDRLKKAGVQAESSDFYKRFKEKVEELNALIRSEPAQVKTDASGSLRRGRIVHAEEAVQSLKLTVYKNGILIKRGPFREMGSPSYISFVRDIMDGYFPGELQAENPDGVIIDLYDMSSEDYDDRSPADRMTGFQLIKRLPKHVVRNGDIIDIQGDIAKKLGECALIKDANISEISKPPLANVNSSASFSGKTASAEASNSLRSSREIVNLNYKTWLEEKKCNSNGNSKGMLTTSLFSVMDSNKPERLTEMSGRSDAEGGKADEGQATIQVKWGSSGTTYILTLPRTCLVGDIRGMLAHYQGYWTEEQVESFELRSTFPPKLLENSLTLAEAGLLPNGTVHAKLPPSA